MTLETPIGELGWLGRQVAKRLKKAGLITARDLLFYFPFRYEDFSKSLPIRDVRVGEPATVRGTIRAIATKRTPRRRFLITEAIIEDTTGALKAVWFNSPYLSQSLKVGDKIALAGTLVQSRWGVALEHPFWEKIEEAGLHTGRLVPIYSAISTITSKQIRTLVAEVIDLVEQLEDPLPAPTRQRHKLIELKLATRSLHFPTSSETVKAGQHRFAFEELLVLHLESGHRRLERAQTKTAKISLHLDKIKSFVSSLPWKLTEAQRRCAWEILRDLDRHQPMARLLAGDVGSGKTAVAVIAIVATQAAGYQSTLLVPTDILAHQHGETLKKILPTGVRLAVLTRTTPIRSERKELIKKIAEGEIDIIVGTHALLERKIQYKNIGLVIVDEQHRFGVAHRAQALAKGPIPHFLSMTATPIPRTLALTLVGDLELSILDELPPGRSPIKTLVVPPQKRKGAYEFIKKEVRAGRQVFVICPLIDPSDTLGVRSATEEYERLKTEIFSDLEVGLLHGQLPAREKERVRTELVSGEIKILVATTVVEVGVDIPNASVMLIEGAERFGLAQLWQLHGRVGRSQYRSWCFLFTESNEPTVTKRLEMVTRAKNGFELAEYDLKNRGPGALAGTLQSGWGGSEFRFADLHDLNLTQTVQKEAQLILAADPTLEAHLGLKTKCDTIVSHPE